MPANFDMCPINKQILIAVDESDNSRRAVSYIAYMLGGVPEFNITLLNIIPVPPDDYFKTEDERRSWIEDHESTAKKVLEEYRQMLIMSKFHQENLDVRIKTGDYPSIADAVLKVFVEISAGTIVIGRRGISKKEEFIFGSTSSRILHSIKNCAALWVVE